jgi:hypothetical protein
VLAACAGRHKAAAPAQAAAPAAAAESGAASVMGEDPKAEITRLDEDITVDRTRLGLDEPTPAMIETAPTTAMGSKPAIEDPMCRPAKTETCTTSCTLSDSICTNADKICTLAQKLSGDAWAAGKCAKANRTCEAAKKKCCGCT